MSVASLNSHARAVEISKQSNCMDAAREVALSKNKHAIVSALRNVYFAAVNDLSNSNVPKLHELCIEQGATQLKDLAVDDHTSYAHNQSIQEFQAAISKVLEDKLLDKVEASKEFSIMIDESTDVSVHQNLLVYIRIVEEIGARWEPRSYFLGVRQLASATADSITREVLDVLTSKGLDVGDMVGISTDGAAVMVGSKSGVVTRLRDSSPSLLATHCIAHRLALGCGSGADKVPYLVKFQEILNSIYNFSPKHMAALESIQEVIEGVEKSRFKQVFATRWLSFEGSVHAVVRNYSSLISVFLEENSAKALSLYKPVSTYKFLFCAHFLSDVLKQLCFLSKMYQKSDLDFSQVNPLLSSTIVVLENLRDSKCGSVLAEFLSVVPSEPMLDSDGLYTFQFKGHTIRDSAQQRKEAVSSCEAFVDHTVSNLKERFSDGKDAKIMSAMCAVLNPSLDGQLSSDDVKTVGDYLSSCGIKDSACFAQELSSFNGYVKVQIIEAAKDDFSAL
ncbi:LOW QUALITY PROTEIN: hypothetical protein KUTeg_018771 [Tegillarca granosa]|uniref:DUF4371 domain-containing protein n=1 Tax=Tegillarca granosa TaxID=220873 RepID=A0ABQ9EGX3_TEGGR|nr:LOW QUALITY PROTEIN: hypothetical protein KUTeg_018771 [Tegillarca granosa]